jgi:hypothetical protein
MTDSAASCLPPFPTEQRLSPEFRLAVACSWIAPPAWEALQNATVAAICEAGLDWEAFLQQVDQHGIPAQALSVLRRSPALDIPDALHQALKARNKQTVFKSLMQTGELIRINRLFKAHDIDMIALKGVTLSQRLYGSPHVRTSSDIDVLIRPENLATADKLLAGLGYRDRQNVMAHLTERQRAAMLIGSHNVGYSNRENRQYLEVHWRSRLWSRDDMETFWRRRQEMLLLEEALGCPDDATLLLFLCDHGARHWWVRLKWLGDVATMLADGGLQDWDAVMTLADRLGLHRVFAQAALLVHGLYGLPLPSPVMALVAGEASAADLANKALAARCDIGKTNRFAWAGLCLEGVRKAIYYRQIRPAVPWGRWVKEFATGPADDYLALPLPDSLFWLYLPLRPVFWLQREYGRRP